MSTSLRLYREEDHPRVLEIEASSFRDPWPPLFFSHVHRKAPNLFIVAEESDAIAAKIAEERDDAFPTCPRWGTF